VGYSSADLDQLRRRTALAELVGRHGVKLVRCGREYVGLCPFHREKTPSFYVVEDKSFFHCFGCGAHGDAIAFLMRIGNVDFLAAVAELAGGRGAAVVDSSAPSAPIGSIRFTSFAAIRARREAQRDKDARNRRLALRLWQDAGPARGTLVETYLRRRGVGLPAAPVLRFAPHCWNREAGRELPAMLARVDDVNGEFVAVHRTYLTADGRKAALRNPKMSLGPVRAGAVQLAPAGPVLAVAEGIEDALSATIAWEIPAWSAVAKGGFNSLPLPPDVREAVIVADYDANGGGELAARRAGERWAAEGRRVRLWRSPRVGEDANKLLLRVGDKDDVDRRSETRVRSGRGNPAAGGGEAEAEWRA
jgi:hypothetical protein